MGLGGDGGETAARIIDGEGLGLQGGTFSDFDPKPNKMHFLLHFYATFLGALQGVKQVVPPPSPPMAGLHWRVAGRPGLDQIKR